MPRTLRLINVRERLHQTHRALSSLRRITTMINIPVVEGVVACTQAGARLQATANSSHVSLVYYCGANRYTVY